MEEETPPRMTVAESEACAPPAAQEQQLLTDPVEPDSSVVFHNDGKPPNVAIPSAIDVEAILPQHAATTNTVKCSKCSKCNKRIAREGCTQLACIQCCDDLVGCEIHKKPRAHAIWKEKILNGTTDVQRMAAAKRNMRIPAGRFFREPGFVYQGDTVVIWDVRAYARNPKRREEAIRKSLRRRSSSSISSVAKTDQQQQRQGEGHVVPRLRNSRKRFRQIFANANVLASRGVDEIKM